MDGDADWSIVQAQAQVVIETPCRRARSLATRPRPRHHLIERLSARFARRARLFEAKELGGSGYDVARSEMLWRRALVHPMLRHELLEHMRMRGADLDAAYGARSDDAGGRLLSADPGRQHGLDHRALCVRRQKT